MAVLTKFPDNVAKHGRFYARGRIVWRRGELAVNARGMEVIERDWYVCESIDCAAGDIARLLAAGEASDGLAAYARAMELIDSRGPNLDVAMALDDMPGCAGALDAWKEGGRDGLMGFLRTLRGRALEGIPS